jgi:hypothetical protein
MQGNKMSAPKPRSSKPRDPRDEVQVAGGPMVCMRVIPDVAPIDKKKLMPGKFAGRTVKAGK